MLHILVSIILVFSLAAAAFSGTEEKKSGDIDMKCIDDALDRAAALSGIKVPENIHKEEAEKEAQKAFEVYRSEEFQKKVAEETESIKREVFKSAKEYYKDTSDGVKKRVKLMSRERIYIFVSSSVPKETLRNYMTQIDMAKDPNITVVMRGFIGGMKFVRPTLEFTHEILKRDALCELPKECELYGVNLEIDPLLFRRYGIDRVPAVVYVPDIGVEDPQSSEGLEDNAKVPDYQLFFGDVALDYAIERINEKAKSESLKAVIRGLREGFYR